MTQHMHVRTWHVSGGGGGDARGARGLGIVETLCTNGKLQTVSPRDGLWHKVLLKTVKAVLWTQQNALQGRQSGRQRLGSQGET